MKLLISKDDLNNTYIVKQNNLELPIIRAGLANIFYLFIILGMIVFCFITIKYYEGMYWPVFLIISLLSLKTYDRVTNKLVVQRNKLIFTCPFRVVTISREQIKWIKVWPQFFWNSGGDILIIIKCNRNIFFKIFHLSTFILGYADRRKAITELKIILDKKVGFVK